MFNPLNLGVFRLLFLVVEVYILAPVGCECVCFQLREKFFIPARYLSLTQRSYWVYTRILPVALDIYEDNTHINPSIGHTKNTGTHMCIFVRIVGLSITSMLECLFLTKGKFFMLVIYLSLVQSTIKKFNPLNLGDLDCFFLVG